MVTVQQHGMQASGAAAVGFPATALVLAVVVLTVLGVGLAAMFWSLPRGRLVVREAERWLREPDKSPE
jgi:protein-S-isoprenylcysteine O-methyltransferase Ste14